MQSKQRKENNKQKTEKCQRKSIKPKASSLRRSIKLIKFMQLDQEKRVMTPITIIGNEREDNLQIPKILKR